MNELRQALDEPTRGRRGEVRPFVRSGTGPYLPGSSLKGALRTAWLAAEAGRSPGLMRGIGAKADRERPGKTGRLSDELAQGAFDAESGKTERDPLRDVAVSDALLLSGVTVIDRVQVANLGPKGGIAFGPEGRMQIHVERLASVADRGDYPTSKFAVALSVPSDEELEARRRRAGERTDGPRRALPRRSPTYAALRRAANEHHAALFEYERRRFYAGTGAEATLDGLLAAFGLAGSDLVAALEAKDAWLLKVGRYGHFESKSVAGLRHGEKRGTKASPPKHMTEGGSRTVAKDASGRPLPFGWVLLLPEGKAPAEAPRLSAASPAQGGPGSRPGGGAPRPGGKPGAGSQPTGFLFRKGDRVTNGDEVGIVEENVGPGQEEMMVNFDGDREPVPVKGWRKA
jgi:CRISPR-associated protein Csm5